MPLLRGYCFESSRYVITVTPITDTPRRDYAFLLIFFFAAADTIVATDIMFRDDYVFMRTDD